MPTIRRSRVIPAEAAELWEIIGDPYHLPRWWPRVQRVEGFDGDRFTQVMSTQKGKSVRADFSITANEEPAVMAWQQDLADTPFERILKQSATSVRLDPEDGGTRVTLVVTQQLRGTARYGAFMMKGATKKTLDGALTGLGELVAPGA